MFKIFQKLFNAPCEIITYQICKFVNVWSNFEKYAISTFSLTAIIRHERFVRSAVEIKLAPGTSCNLRPAPPPLRFSTICSLKLIRYDVGLFSLAESSADAEFEADARYKRDFHRVPNAAAVNRYVAAFMKCASGYINKLSGIHTSAFSHTHTQTYSSLWHYRYVGCVCCKGVSEGEKCD